ncbi:MAG: hypothetical protein BV458_12625 [Thermoplasmata archaeon M9B2D]|nr:MAG: hypothetical protein BV458_12625 [Thermoplasmata archaeon M9B2D]
MENEFLDIVDSEGNTTGIASREDVHRNKLLHKVVHLLVFNSSGELLLQKRSRSKEIEPGKWDTSVGGHVHSGEAVRSALFREMQEELGLISCSTEFLYSYIYSGAVEKELVHSFRCTFDGELFFNKREIDEIKFWFPDDISEQLQSDVFSDHFREEFNHYRDHLKR